MRTLPLFSSVAQTPIGKSGSDAGAAWDRDREQARVQARRRSAREAERAAQLRFALQRLFERARAPPQSRRERGAAAQWLGPERVLAVPPVRSSRRHRRPCSCPCP